MSRVSASAKASGPGGVPGRPACQRRRSAPQAQLPVQRLAAVPDLLAVPVVGHPGQADRVPGHLGRAGRAVPEPDQQPGRLQRRRRTPARTGRRPRTCSPRGAALPGPTRRSSRARPAAAARPAAWPACWCPRRAGSGQRLPQLRQGEVRRQLARRRTRSALRAAVRSPGRPTAYPVTSPGLWALCRSRTCSPRLSRAAKNSGSERAPAAAAATWRCSVTRGGSARPVRAAFSCSARVGLFAAVRSARATTTRPYSASDVAQRFADPVVVVVQLRPAGGPAGPASPRCGCGCHRGGRPPTALPGLPRHAGTGRCGA